MIEGRIIKGVGGLYDVAADDGAQYRVRAKGKFRRQGLSPLVGDRVRIAPETQGDGWMEEILPRRNQLMRPAVANIDRLLLLAAPVPQADLLLLDRLLLTAVHSDIEPLILLNKTDLDSENLLAGMRAAYGAVFPVLGISTVTGAGLEQVRAAMAGRVCCLAGQSAVGKSSLINALLPGLALQTGEVSRMDRGRHTTRHAQMLPTWQGGYVVDTPGFSLLACAAMPPEDFAAGYPDYAALAEQCRFQVCLHDREPGCAVRAAVEAGTLDAGRYERYRALLKEVQEKWRTAYDTHRTFPAGR